MKHRGKLLLLFVLLCLGGLVSTVQAQTTYGAIVGTARDTTGAIVPAVKVVVTNHATGETHEQPTNEVGNYAFTTLFPGTYTVHAVAAGFKQIGRASCRE